MHLPSICSFAHLLRVIVLLAVAAVAAQATPPPAAAQSAAKLTEDQKIEALIAAVERLQDAVFIRNDAEHDGRAAALHMRRKWNSGRKHIKTAADFIEHAASRSSETGRPYLIRFNDGREVTSAAF